MARTIVSASNKWLTRSSAVLTASPMTLACWGRPTTIALSALVTINDGSAQYWGLCVNNSGGASAIYNAGAGSNQTDSGTSSSGVWGHYGAVFTSSVRRAYFNASVVSTSGAQSSPTGLNRTQIGTLWSGGALPYDGDIAEAAIWNVELDAGEFTALAAGIEPSAIRPTALVDYWPLVGQYSPEIDLIGRNELTLNNTPVAAPHCRIFYRYTPAFVAKAGTLYHITGITKNSSGTALASCTVKLFRASDDLLIASTTSDGSGNYSFNVGNNTTQYYLVAYKAGSPDVAGTTKNNLVGA